MFPERKFRKAAVLPSKLFKHCSYRARAQGQACVLHSTSCDSCMHMRVDIWKHH